MSKIHTLFKSAMAVGAVGHANEREDFGLNAAMQEVPNILVVEDNTPQALKDFMLQHHSALLDIWFETKQHNEDCAS